MDIYLIILLLLITMKYIINIEILQTPLSYDFEGKVHKAMYISIALLLSNFETFYLSIIIKHRILTYRFFLNYIDKLLVIDNLAIFNYLMTQNSYFESMKINRTFVCNHLYFTISLSNS